MCKGISRREPGFRVQNWGSVLTLWRRSAKSGERVTFPIKASDYAANRRNSAGQFPRAAFGSYKGTSGDSGIALLRLWLLLGQVDRSRVPRNAGLNARNGTLTAPEFGGLHSQGSAASVESSILGYSGDTPTNIFRRYPSGAASTPKTDYLSIIKSCT